jgi:hypothetical protein
MQSPTCRRVYHANRDQNALHQARQHTNRVDMSKPKKLDRNGVPVDRNQWTEQDWQDLNEAVEATRRKIAARHAEAKQPAGEEER